MSFSLSGNVVDLRQNRIFKGTVTVNDGKISRIKEENVSENHYILPGFIDAHIHIESSMLAPSEFARVAVTHGTVATVSDPHEIANVLGVEGIKYMIENSKKTPFKTYFGAPSCVPATTFETAGAEVNARDIRSLFQNEGLKYLSEMMNYPGVLHRDPMVMEKIALAKEFGVPVDGHSPGLMGEEAKSYISAGISTDHECFTLKEAIGKVELGMKIIIREGSAAKNYEALHPLIKTHPKQVMFCSDDKHPDDLAKGHINETVKRSIALGYEPLDVLRCASLNPVEHYQLDVGLLQEGDFADFIVVDSLENLEILSTYISGKKVSENKKTLIDSVPIHPINHFSCSKKKPSDFTLLSSGEQIRVIEAIPNELITNELVMEACIKDKTYVSDTKRDLLKICVVNRYQDVQPAVAFIKGIGLNRGAIASSVAHDSHNIVAVGVDDDTLCQAVNAIIENKGGVAVVDNNRISSMPLQIAGLMSDRHYREVSKKYAAMKAKANALGSPLHDPFMTLSFMALLVIPSLKLSDLGLFNGSQFELTSLNC